MSLLDEFGRSLASDDPWSALEREINDAMGVVMNRMWQWPPPGGVLDKDGNLLPESEPRKDIERAQRKRGQR